MDLLLPLRGTTVSIRPNMAVATDHPGRIPSTVFLVLDRRIGESAYTQKLVVDREERSLPLSSVGLCDMLPTAKGSEEPVIRS